MRAIYRPTVFLSLLLMLALIVGACTPGADQPVIIGGDAPAAGQATPVGQEEPAPGDPALTTPQMPGAFGVVGADEGYMMLATALLGRNVVSMNDENLGDVDDFLIDLTNGNVPFALITHGGFLGIGRNQAAVPLSAFSLGLEENNLVLNLTEDQFETFPDVDIDNNWPVGLDTGWDADLRNFWTNAGFDVSEIDGAITGTVVRASQLVGFGFGTGLGTGVAPGGAVAPADPALTTPVTDTTATGAVADPAAAMANLGNTADYIVDLGAGRVEYAVLSFSDVATFGEEWVIVPFQAIETTPLGDQVLLDQGIDWNLLTGAPRIVGGNLADADFFAPGWDEAIRTYWSEQGYDLAQATGEPATDATPAAQATPAEQATPAPDAGAVAPGVSGGVGIAGAEADYMMLASALLGRNVQSAAGDNLGDVDDFVIDLTSGNVPFALVSHGGFLGIGQDQAPVPLSAFSVNLEDEALVLNVTEDQLEGFPEVEIDNDWPTSIGAGWDTDLRNFWTNTGFDVGTIQGTEAGSVVRASQLVNSGFGFGTGPGATNTDTAMGQGNLEDYIVDLSDGQVRYAVLSFADTTTFGMDWVIVPFQAVGSAMQTRTDDGFMLDQTLNNEVLTAAPRVQGDMLADAEFFGPGWDDEIRTYWSDQGYQFD